MTEWLTVFEYNFDHYEDDPNLKDHSVNYIEDFSSYECDRGETNNPKGWMHFGRHTTTPPPHDPNNPIGYAQSETRAAPHAGRGVEVAQVEHLDPVPAAPPPRRVRDAADRPASAGGGAGRAHSGPCLLRVPAALLHGINK